ncbi:sigma-70 family RNA polymerase sigma factor [Candidatus Chloroploca sp. M-50]|uniref:Sigma-70 family RNA polymerase sigma factor n=1 Tax=Candidatus Chloroploca mongolica TaxID=2528176 RepID=A0ABS4D4S1_9CHLR|nr:sigma-70 family RNA polymerase sigma factor [Candidatus Chloroploca mongolica]MBP1464429.1 sigma-70 family RNA polymerase sigma factor [Candidatus Chloroploca mongolica]
MAYQHPSVDQMTLLNMIAQCNAEFGWDLRASELERYAQSLVRCLPENVDHAKLELMVLNYHLYHQQVAALQNRSHPDHDQLWATWLQEVVQFITRGKMASLGDHALDADDLAQAALCEMSRSLKNFQYRSSLKTWVHTVVVQTIRRTLRDLCAKKRPRGVASLDEMAEEALVICDACEPAEEACGEALIALVCDLLERVKDQRTARIFYLAVVDDLSTEQIGKIVHLHQSRVRALLMQARTLLKARPEIQAWLADHESSPFV